MSGRPAPRAVRWVAAATLLGLHLPVLVLALFSFNASRYGIAWTGATLDWYARLLERPDILRAFGLSLWVGFLATALATVTGTLLALGLHDAGPRWRRTGGLLLYLPVVTPEILSGISLLVLFSLLGVPLGVTSVVLAHTAFAIPFVTLLVLARARALDPALEEAALLLGADPWTAFRRVRLPLLAPAIGAGALLAFTLSFDDVVITFFVTGPGGTTLPLLIFGMVRRSVEPTINALSTVALGLTTLLFLAAERLERRGGAA